MRTKIEIHILQNFPPSNLNRSDTGAPKDGMHGGVRRARVSSQCWKRQIRETFRAADLLAAGELALRTKSLAARVAERVTAPGVAPDRIMAAVSRALAGGKLKVDPATGTTEYLLFVPVRIVDAIAALVTKHLDVLLAAAPAPAPAEGEEPAKPRAAQAAKRAAKAAAKEEVPPELQAQLAELLADSARTPELALFGSMVADAPERNVEAACQVAHALSTHAAEIGFDYWTGKADDSPAGASGAEMVGTSAFVGACFYRYLAVDLAQLVTNLGGDGDAKAQGQRTLAAFLRAAALAIPTGKQNAMSAQSLPSLVLVDVRGGPLRTLANAFERPVHPTGAEHGSIVETSVLRLGEQLAQLDTVYGASARRDLSFVLIDPSAGKTLGKAFSERVPAATQRASLDELVQVAVAAAFRDAA